MWEMMNSNNWRWGTETYSTKEAAEKELRDFWRGYKAVDLRKFRIVPVGSVEPPKRPAY